MERDDGEPSKRRERINGRSKPFAQSADFVVDRDTERLKGFSCRMNLAVVIPRRSSGENGSNKRTRRENASTRTYRDNGARDAAREAFFAVREDKIGKRFFGGTVDDIGGRLACPEGGPGGLLPQKNQKRGHIFQ